MIYSAVKERERMKKIIWIFLPVLFLLMAKPVLANEWAEFDEMTSNQPSEPDPPPAADQPSPQGAATDVPDTPAPSRAAAPPSRKNLQPAAGTPNVLGTEGTLVDLKYSRLSSRLDRIEREFGNLVQQNRFLEQRIRNLDRKLDDLDRKL